MDHQYILILTYMAVDTATTIEVVHWPFCIACLDTTWTRPSLLVKFAVICSYTYFYGGCHAWLAIAARASKEAIQARSCIYLAPTAVYTTFSSRSRTTQPCLAGVVRGQIPKANAPCTCEHTWFPWSCSTPPQTCGLDSPRVFIRQKEWWLMGHHIRKGVSCRHERCFSVHARAVSCQQV